MHRGLLVIAACLSFACSVTGATASFPGREGLIAFMRETEGPRGTVAVPSAIYVIGRNGVGVRRLTPTTFARNPAWSPDGTKIVYDVSSSSTRRGGSDLWVMTADGSHKRLVARGANYAAFPAWSPDGTQVAYLHAENRGVSLLNIAVVNADGSGNHDLTFSDRATQPTWSPDGTRIAYLALDQRGNPRGVAVMRGDGSHGRLVVRDSQVGAPDWSPDGRWLAFSRNGVITTARSDGSHVRAYPASGSSGPAGQPRWSPSGAGFVFLLPESLHDCSCGGSLRILSAGTVRSLTDPPFPVVDSEPSWQPVCTVRGTPHDDALAGLGTICGLGGDDVIRGGRGGVTAIGGDGNDAIYGGRGHDRLFGAAGNDTIESRDGARDVVNCGPGRDQARVDRRDLVSRCERVSRPRP